MCAVETENAMASLNKDPAEIKLKTGLPIL